MRRCGSIMNLLKRAFKFWIKGTIFIVLRKGDKLDVMAWSKFEKVEYYEASLPVGINGRNGCLE